ncbi:hypothetical protein ACIBIZ_15760 [Nonomuraea spiralis]|uniref:hypothetical protein n=1 Tax=Nonomuraea spiralis TaxID=46182 RepID=UPI00378DBDBF
MQHGWTHVLRLARDPSPVARQEARGRCNGRWTKALPPEGPQKLSKAREAATDTAKVDLADWLSENPNTIEHIQKVGDILVDFVIKELDERFGGSDPQKARKRLNDHLWCDILATLAEALEKFSKVVDQIPASVTTVIMQSREAERRGVLPEALVRVAVQMAWAPIKAMIKTLGVEELQRTCRILAVLICPAPERHKAVRDGALLPLAKEGLLETSKERLKQVFPADWIHRLQEGLGDV